LAIHEAIGRGEVPAEIALVASDRPEAPGLARAIELGLPVAAVPAGADGREGQERRLLAELAAARVDWVCLAGYMRVLSPAFLAAYPDRIVNIHPSLLPAFPGRGAQRQALAHGVKVSGCTVHLVDAGVDSGPIVVQRAVPVEDGDTPESLAARILEEEHRAYPQALRQLLAEPWRLDGRRLLFGRK
jgi:phosphoribosylglycinamide formyltransferase-1